MKRRTVTVTVRFNVDLDDADRTIKGLCEHVKDYVECGHGLHDPAVILVETEPTS